jgi:hypothetical protein
LLRRLRCEDCKELHTELPDIIQPYKHYDSAAIQSVLDGSEDSDTCVADNSTIHRWKSEFKNAESDIAQRLASIHSRMTDEKVPIFLLTQILNNIRVKHKRWLAFVMELLINNGYKLCTQFAFCLSPSSGNFSLSTKNESERGKHNDQTIKNSS